MIKWIRWSGLISFVVIITILVLLWLLAAGPLIKMALETAGTKVAEAKVDIHHVDLTLNPLGVVVEGIHITDADNPMTNLISIDRTDADLALIPLLLGKGIIENMSMTGVAFGTERTQSGALNLIESSSKTIESIEKSSVLVENEDSQKFPFSVQMCTRVKGRNCRVYHLLDAFFNFP